MPWRSRQPAGIDARRYGEHVVNLVEEVAAPPSAAELRREEAAVAMFHAARTDTTRRPVTAQPTAAKATTRSAMAIAATTLLATGGLAFASTGIVPDQDRTPEHRTDQRATPTEHPSWSAPSGPRHWSAEQGPEPRPIPHDPTGSTGSETGRPDSPGIKGLCQAFLARSKSGRSAMLETAPYLRLVEAAGGTKSAPDYCSRLLDSQAKPDKPAKQDKKDKADKKSGKKDKPKKKDKGAQS
ncbi:MAG: hypothetical protein ACRCYQ_15540 [Nocardioides sp.]